MESGSSPNSRYLTMCAMPASGLIYFYVPADPAKEVNLLHPLDFQETEAPFEINVIFHTKAGAPGIWWKLEKETWNSLGRKMPPAVALAPKDVLPLR